MTFISDQFVAFFVVVVAAYFLMPARWRWSWLLVASLAFYAFAGPIFLVQMLAVTAATFVFALRAEGSQTPARRRLWTTASIAVLLGNLVGFKYLSFLNETLRSLLGWVSIPYDGPVIAVVIPLGISFYTLQLIGYAVDVHRGEAPERSLGRFTLFVSFFPKLVAGPIERSKTLLPQLWAERVFSYAGVVLGLQLILWGLFKKVVVADRIAPFVDWVYNDPRAYDGVMLTLTTWAYAFQLYCDFSGYTDIALGCAAIFGIKLIQNFNRPYLATSIQDFWKRWHISLTSWLTDYVYNPLIRQKVVKVKFYNMMLIGMMATFLVSGLWHGAEWKYVVWGALHGSYIVAALLLQKSQAKAARAIGLMKRPGLYRGLKIFATFNMVCFAYIVFRANNLEDAGYIISHLFTGWPQAFTTVKQFMYGHWVEGLLAGLGVAVVIIADVWRPFSAEAGRSLPRSPIKRWGLYYAATLTILLFGAFYGSSQQFVYFRF